MITSRRRARFSYTSNVDAHFYDVLDAGEIRALGNVGSTSAAGGDVVVEDEEEGEKVLYMSKKCLRSVWRAPSNLRPTPSPQMSMLAEDGARASSLAAKTDQLDKATIGHTGGTERDPTTTLQHMPPPLNDRSKTFDKNWPVCPRAAAARGRPSSCSRITIGSTRPCRTGATASGRRRCAGSRRRRAPHQIHSGL